MKIGWPEKQWRRAITPMALVAVASFGCTSPAVLPGEGSVVTGRWGAAHAGLTVTDSGGRIEYDCAHGGFVGPLRVDRAGRFALAGVHVPEHGGPVRVGEVPDSLPARYVGQITDDRMRLHVILSSDTLGPFELRRGAEPQLFRCL